MAGRTFEYVVEIVGARGTGQDRAAAFERGNALVVVLADGAGGTGNGSIAAQAIVDAVSGDHASTDWSDLLFVLDEDSSRLGGGQSTAVILSIASSGITGTSVGDSCAWIVDANGLHDITAGQVRKPLVGSGCSPAAVVAGPLGNSTLIVASDGLFNYAKRSDIVRAVNGASLEAAARALVELVRLPSGALQDDISVVLVRQRDS